MGVYWRGNPTMRRSWSSTVGQSISIVTLEFKSPSSYSNATGGPRLSKQCISSSCYSDAGGERIAEVAMGNGTRLGSFISTSAFKNKKPNKIIHGTNGSGTGVTREELEWDEHGRLLNWDVVLTWVARRGVASNAKSLVWPFLLGVFSPVSTFEERAVELQRLKNVYTKLVFVCEEFDSEIEAIKMGKGEQRGAASPAKIKISRRDDGMIQAIEDGTSTPRGGWVSSSCESSPEKQVPGQSPRLSGNYASFAEAHRIIVMDAVRTDMKTISNSLSSSGMMKDQDMPQSWEIDQLKIAKQFTSNIISSNSHVTVLPVSVCEGLPELMLVDPPRPKPSQAVATGEPPVWRSKLALQMIDGSRHLTSACRRLMMRLVNVLSAYAVHDPENGYCQGMSDLAAVFVCLEDEDALAFACFEKFMRTVRQNFKHDESGIKQQLIQVSEIIADTDAELYKKLVSLESHDCMFAYRMVVVLLRRELPLHETLTLWEVSWAFDTLQMNDQHGSPSGSEFPNPRTISLLGSKSNSASSLNSTVESMNKLFIENSSENELRNMKRASSASKSKWRGHELKCNASPPGFLLQFVAAVIKTYRTKILKECRESDDILRLFNRIDIDFWGTLTVARKQHKAYHQGIAVMQSLYS